MCMSTLQKLLNRQYDELTLPATPLNIFHMEHIEHINRIELQGHVGTVRTNEHNGNRVANFTLATELMYKSREGRYMPKGRFCPDACFPVFRA